MVSRDPYLQAKVEVLKDVEHSGKGVNALVKNISGLFKLIVDLSPHLPDELVQLSRNVDQPGPLADMIVSTLNLDRNKKQQILDCLDIKERLKKLTLFLNEELELQKTGARIQNQVLNSGTFCFLR